MISGKYFVLESDSRFPLTLPSGEWQNLANEKFITPTGQLSIYLLKGNDSFYVGSDAKGKRPYNHKRALKRGDHINHYMQNTANKYGYEIFYYQPLCIIPTEYIQYRDEIENSYIKLFDTYNNGYNLVEFADTPMMGRKLSEKTKEKISEKTKARLAIFNPNRGRKISQERVEALRKRMRRKFKGKNNPNYGKRHSNENLEKMRGPRPSISGKNHPNFNKQLSNKTVRRIKEAKSIPFYLISPDGKLTYIKICSDFCKNNNLNQTSIYHLKNKKINYYAGWTRPKNGELRDLTEEEISQIVLQEKNRRNNIIEKLRNTRKKDYYFYYNNNLIKIENLKDFCRKNSLSYNSMGCVYHGFNGRKIYKGYTSAKNITFSGVKI